jgi:YidC/Oxa1 family membrane protein insertase
MDKKSLIGIGIIGAILIGWMYFSRPGEKELAAQKRITDSIAAADSTARAKEIEKQIAAAKAEADSARKTTDTSKIAATAIMSDSAIASLATKKMNEVYRGFVVSAKGTDSVYTIENNFIKAYVSSKGGKIERVELKQYNRANDKAPMVLFNGDSLSQEIIMNAYTSSLLISTDSLYFVPQSGAVASAGPGNKEATLTMRLKTDKDASYIDFVYKLKPDSYMMDYDVVFSNMQSILGNSNDVTLNWNMQLPSQELHIEKEKQTSGIFYQTIEPNGETDVDNLSLTSSADKSIPESDLKWVAFKQQFFSSILVAKSRFMKGSLFKTYVDKTNSSVVKTDKAVLGFTYEGKPSETFGMQFYYGPNQYYSLKDQDMGFEHMIPMGWSIFKYLNKWLVIPIFNAFKDSSFSMGWVILILTLIIKILLLPIAYRTYLSSAKMRLLKPEIDAIKAKHGGDQMKSNQENMALYKRAGASPLSGCIPALLQLPILIALLNFFPASFELRQKEFLWASDLSTYDSVWDFGHVAVINSIYGDHVSLFALLMFVSTIVYTWMNQKMMPMNNQQMPGMQVMMYLMPLIFLSFMNSYSAGLSWYYFLANMITFGQTFMFRYFVSDKKLRAKIEENMKKPAKKSSFQQRLEAMQKQQTAARRK